jgi:hypothetical protein
MDSERELSFSNSVPWIDSTLHTPYKGVSTVFERAHFENVAGESFPVEGLVAGGYIALTQKFTSPLYWNPEEDPIAELSTFKTTIFDSDGKIYAHVESNDATRVAHVSVEVPIDQLIQAWSIFEINAER